MRSFKSSATRQIRRELWESLNSSKGAYYREMSGDGIKKGRLPFYLTVFDSNVTIHIARAKLFNHHLKSETGSWAQHVLVLSDRNCSICNTYEDIYHVIVQCPRYAPLRTKLNIDVNNVSKLAFFDMLNSDNYQLLNQFSYFYRESSDMQLDVYRAEMLPRIPVGHYRRPRT